MSYTMVCAIFHIIGIYLAKSVTFSYMLIFSLVAIGIALVWWLISKKINLMFILAMVMLLVGGFSYGVADYNRLYDLFPDKEVTVTGVIVSSPAKSSGEFCNRYVFRPKSITCMEQTVEVDKRILIRTDVPYRYGDILEISGELKEIEGADNQHEYDYSHYYKSKGIYNQIKATTSRKIGEISYKNPKYWVGGIRNLIHESIFEHYGGEQGAIYNAVILGDKSYLSDSYTVKLLRTGVWQGLYSPYIHIVVLTLLAGLFKRGRGKNKLLLALLLFYALANAGNPNAIKASLLAGSVILLRLVMGYSDKMQQMSFLVLVLTLINPMLCFSRGFIMSVSSTVILFVFYPQVFGLVCGLLKKTHINSRKLAVVLTIAIVLVLGNMPLSAYMFNGTSIFSTIISTLLIPVIVSIIAISTVHLPLLYFGVVWGATEGAIDTLLGFLEKLPGYVEKILLHYISLRTPTFPELVCAYLVIWLMMQIIAGGRRDAIFKLVSAVTLSLMLVTGILRQHPGLEIYFVNVGQGDSAILHTSGNETILIDGGGAAEYYTGDYNVGDRVLVPYMISHGFNKVDYAIVSHYHKDHVEGVISVVKNMKVRNLVMPDCADGNIYREELEALAKDKGIRIHYAKEHDLIWLKSGLKIKFLAPDEKQAKDEDLNSTSLVMRVDYNYFCGIFAGDSDDRVNEDYPKYVDILKVSHHGSKNTNTAEDIMHMSPKYAIISVGRDNVYKLPAPLVVDWLEKAGAKILRTDVLGDIRFKINKYGILRYDSLRKE